jgi:hypothetical protein
MLRRAVGDWKLVLNAAEKTGRKVFDRQRLVPIKPTLRTPALIVQA